MSESSFAPPTPRRLDLRVRIADTDEPNAFTVGRKASNALVVVTSGVCVRLTDEELDAVLAHGLQGTSAARKAARAAL